MAHSMIQEAVCDAVISAPLENPRRRFKEGVDMLQARWSLCALSHIILI